MRRWALRALPFVVVAVVFGLALPKIASYRDVIDEVADASGRAIAVLVAATVLNVITFAPPWQAAFAGLGFVRALLVTQASTATASLLPGGEAVGAGFSVGILRAWGFSRGAIAAGLAVLTAFNLLTKVVFALLALAAVLATGGAGGPLAVLTVVGVAVAAAVVVVATLALRSDAAAHRVGTLGGRVFERVRALLRRPPGQPLGDRLVHFRREMVGLLGTRGAWIAAGMLVGNLTVFLVLLVAMRAVGIGGDDVSVAEAFAGWSLVRLVTAIPITPGGIGVVELGLTGALVAAGADQAEAVAAVLLYRLCTWAPPILLGIPSFLFWRRLRLR